MSDREAKPTRINPKSEAIKKDVDFAWAELGRGRLAQSVSVKVSDRHVVDFIIESGSDQSLIARLSTLPVKWLLGGQKLSEKKWMVRYVANFELCAECRTFIESVPGQVYTKDEIIDCINRVVTQIRISRCYEEGSGSGSEDERRRMTVADKRKPRIKVLESDAVASPQSGSVKVPNRPETSLSQHAARITVTNAIRGIERSQERSYSEPVFRYALASGERVEVTIELSVCEMLMEHCSASRRHGREVGGILVGDADRSDKPAVFNYQSTVTDLIKVHSPDSSGSHICFDEDAWRFIGREMAAKFEPQGKKRLGWYHTHPTQGIFFSAQDLDAHQAFGSPYQFALVIDPRNMEAGLFYWEGGRGSSLEGPIRFTLIREQERQPPMADARAKDEVKEAEERGPASGFRLLLFLLVAFSAALFVARSNAFLKVDPDHACLLAFVAFLGLRLWNASSFHPEDPVEAIVAERLGDSFYAMLAKLGRGLERIPTWIFIVSIGVSLLAMLFLIDRETSFISSSFDERSLEALEEPANRPDGNTRASTQVIELLVMYEPSRRRLTIKSTQPETQIEYNLMVNKGNNRSWSANAEGERKFLKTVFQWDTKAAETLNYVRAMQKNLSVQIDGVWGAGTRNALLERVLRMRSGEVLPILLPGDKKGSVKIERAQD